MLLKGRIWSARRAPNKYRALIIFSLVMRPFIFLFSQHFEHAYHRPRPGPQPAKTRKTWSSCAKAAFHCRGWLPAKTRRTTIAFCTQFFFFITACSTKSIYTALFLFLTLVREIALQRNSLSPNRLFQVAWTCCRSRPVEGYLRGQIKGTTTHQTSQQSIWTRLRNGNGHFWEIYIQSAQPTKVGGATENTP